MACRSFLRQSNPTGGWRRYSLTGMELRLDAAQLNALPGIERRFMHGSSIEEGTVGGAEVVQFDDAILDRDAAVRPGNRAVLDLEIAIRTASERIDTWSELDLPLLGGTWIDQQARHGLSMTLVG